MSLEGVRRHHQSRLRSNEDADSSDGAVGSPRHDTSGPSVDSSTPTRAGAASASARNRSSAASWVGTGAPGGATGTAAPEAAPLPSSSRANSSRVSAESRLLQEPAHHTTA